MSYSNRGYYRQARTGTGRRLLRMVAIAIALVIAVGYGMARVLPPDTLNADTAIVLWQEHYSEIGLVVLILTIIVGSL